MQAQSLNFPQPDAKILDSSLFALDEPAEWLAFSESTSDVTHNTWESRISIEGMHCAACAFSVERALKATRGVVSCDVSASAGRARVVWLQDQTKPSAWMHAIQQVGYQVFPQSNTEFNRRKQSRLLMWRWLVAGFCMMQVMMYAYPVYISNQGDITPDLVRLMRWASWVLTLPVMLFSSGPFFNSALNDLKHRRISMDLPVALGILITFCVSTLATFEPSGWWGTEVYFDSLTMFVFFLLTGRWIEARLSNKTAGALENLMRRLPASVERLNIDGTFTRVAVRNLKVQDVVRVLPGEAFPADGQIISGNTNADEALLTGESRPVSKVLHAKVIAGSHNLTSAVEVLVEKLGSSTQYAQIVALMERVSLDKPRLAILADRVAKPFLLLVLIAAGLSAIILWPSNHAQALMAAVSVLIVTCPCALSLATPAAMLASAGALARRGVLVRRLQALEALTSVDTVIFDKTGTLTKDAIQVSDIQTHQGLSQQQCLSLASSIATHSLHPVSKALVTAYNKTMTEGVDAGLQVSNVKEISGFGLIANSPALGEMKLGSAKYCEVEVKSSSVMQVFMRNSHGLLATFTLTEEIRDDATSTIRVLQDLGLSVWMLSGDRASAARAIAQTLEITQVLADCTPQQKLAHMQMLQKNGRKVLMVGDGLNDGPVLAGAQVSVAMGQAVPLAQAQSDFVIQSAQLSVLPLLWFQARKTMKIVKQNLVWAALYNAICVPLAVMGYLPAWLAGLGMACSSLLVIINASRLSRAIPQEKI
jgi:Cu2+-exporting ATPase